VLDDTLPRVRDRHFIRQVAPKSEKYRPQRRCVVFTKHGRKQCLCTVVKNVMLVFFWRTVLRHTIQSQLLKDWGQTTGSWLPIYKTMWISISILYSIFLYCHRSVHCCEEFWLTCTLSIVAGEVWNVFTSIPFTNPGKSWPWGLVTLESEAQGFQHCSLQFFFDVELSELKKTVLYWFYLIFI
jgi:hypothetical protein